MSSIVARNNGLVILLLASLLSVSGIYHVGKSMITGWKSLRVEVGMEKPIDFLQRADECRFFSAGIYPNGNIAPKHGPPPNVYTVYPPYAFPLFALLYSAESLKLSLFILNLCSISSLFLMMWLGWRTLAACGTSTAFLGVAMALGLAGNGSCLLRGQLSLICMGLVILQMVLMKCNKPIPAGLCWALAMIKPQNAISFALLFLMRNQVIGLLFGALLVTILTSGALFWTSTSPMELLHVMTTGNALSFIHEPKVVIGVCSLTPHMSPLLLVIGALALFLGASWYLVSITKDLKIPELTAFALCATLGFLLFYHHHYDTVMLFPLLLELVRNFLSGEERGSAVNAVTIIMLGTAVYFPLWIMNLSPILMSLYLMAPLLALLLLFHSMRHREEIL